MWSGGKNKHRANMRKKITYDERMALASESQDACARRKEKKI